MINQLSGVSLIFTGNGAFGLLADPLRQNFGECRNGHTIDRVLPSGRLYCRKCYSNRWKEKFHPKERVGRRCARCNSSIDHLRLDALYCGRRCKSAAFRVARPGDHRCDMAKRRLSRKQWAIKNREYFANYRRENSDRIRSLLQRYRANKVGSLGHFTSADWAAVQRIQRGRCARCGQKCKLTVDHIVPLSVSRNNLALNIQGLCKSCNSSKHDSIPSIGQFTLFDQISNMENFKDRVGYFCGFAGTVYGVTK